MSFIIFVVNNIISSKSYMFKIVIIKCRNYNVFKTIFQKKYFHKKRIYFFKDITIRNIKI